MVPYKFLKQNKRGFRWRRAAEPLASQCPTHLSPHMKQETEPYAGGVCLFEEAVPRSTLTATFHLPHRRPVSGDRFARDPELPPIVAAHLHLSGGYPGRATAATGERGAPLDCREKNRRYVD